MNQPVWWYLARSAGMVAWGLSVLSVLWGTALATRALGKRPTAPWLLDLHRALGTLTIAFVGVHLAALVADSDVYFGWAELFVPLASTWRPWPVTAGVIAFYFLVAIEVTSRLRKRLPKRFWHGVHLTSYLVAVLATGHAVTAGHDARNRLFVVSVVVSAGLVLFFLIYRLSVDDERPVRVSATARAAAARTARTAAVGEPAVGEPAVEDPAVEPAPVAASVLGPSVPATVASGGGGGEPEDLTAAEASLPEPAGTATPWAHDERRERIADRARELAAVRARAHRTLADERSRREHP